MLRPFLLCALFLVSACATSKNYAPLAERAPEASLRRRSHPNGQLRYRVETIIGPRGRELDHGREQRWFADGTPERDALWEHGELVGLLRSWWPDGTPRALLDYADRRTLASCRWFHPNGEVEGKGLALAGRKEGLWNWYHSNSELSHEGNYRHGQREGLWRFFREDGSPLAEGTYVAGRRVVPWTVWDEAGVATTRDFDPDDRAPRAPDDAPKKRRAAGES